MSDSDLGENLPTINPIPGFEPGCFPTDRTVQELDGQAECAGWMPEPRHMQYIRMHPCYQQPISQLVAEYDIANFAAVAIRAAHGGRPRVIQHPNFIFWRMLDWGCGLDSAVCSWLDRYCGGSVTAALKSGDPAMLERFYASHLGKPDARCFPAAPLCMTGNVDVAEWKFGFHSLPDIAVLVPFLIKKAAAVDAHLHDAVYFLVQSATFLARGYAEGAKLLEPHLDSLKDLARHLTALPEEGVLAVPSEYSDLSVLGEARLGMSTLLNALDKGDDPGTYINRIWSLDTLDTLYDAVWDSGLCEQTITKLTRIGHTEDAMRLVLSAWNARAKRHGPRHNRALLSLIPLATLVEYTRAKKNAGAAEAT